MALTKDQIFAVADITTAEVQVPEWGGSVLVRTMSAAQRDAFLATLRDADGKFVSDNYQVKIVAASVVDDAGNIMFQPGDIPALANKSAAALQRVFDKAQTLSGLASGAVDAAAKN